MSKVRRGEIVRVDLRGALGKEKEKERPCLVVQNEKGNQFSPLTIIAPLTDANQFKSLPVQVLVPADRLPAKMKDSVIECGHIRTIDVAERVLDSYGTLEDDDMRRVDEALRVSLGLK